MRILDSMSTVSPRGPQLAHGSAQAARCASAAPQPFISCRLVATANGGDFLPVHSDSVMIPGSCSNRKTNAGAPALAADHGEGPSRGLLVWGRASLREGVRRYRLVRMLAGMQREGASGVRRRQGDLASSYGAGGILQNAP